MNEIIEIISLTTCLLTGLILIIKNDINDFEEVLKDDEENDLDLYLNEEDYQNLNIGQDKSDIFQCVLTLNIPRSPLIDKYGFTYDKKMIIEWVKDNKCCPINRGELQIKDLRINMNIREVIKYEMLKTKYGRLLNNL